MSKWQPISTAPRDGTPILIIRIGESVHDMEITTYYVLEHDVYEEREDGLFEKSREVFSEGWNGNGHRATHWMPLPEPPEAA
jgi:Protein of unknown function (DUF551)